MKILGNILWHFPFFGFVNALFMFLWGLLFTVSIIGAPIGLGLIEFSKFLLAPFSRSMVLKEDLNIAKNPKWETYSLIVKIIWIPVGICFSIFAILQIFGLFLSIIGIPVAIILAKSLDTYFSPVNKKCVHSAVAEELERRKAQDILDKELGSISN